MARKRKSNRNALPALFAGMLTVLLLLIAVAAVLFILSWARGSLARPGGMPGLPGSTAPSENVKYEFGSMLPVWTGKRRVTVLVLGIDERAQETGPWRTDTIILTTLNPVTKQAGVLSIPRDLWVPIPGYNSGRINTAHFLGDLYGYEGGGPALAKATVEYNFGEPINYYVRLNFQGFVKIVDLIGGVDIYVEQRIDDPQYPDGYYGVEHLVIEPGWHHFDGEMALKYARTRHGSSDFARARRQQQVMLAVLDRITSLDLLPDLARNAPKIYQTLEDSIQTDLALDQILALANLATQVEHENIRFGVIDATCTENWTTPDGAQVLIPLRDQMRRVVSYVFWEDVTPTPAATNAPPATAIPAITPTPENATIAVLNGTTRAGLAGSTGAYLKDHGVSVSKVDNADRQDYANSLVILNHDKPATAARLIELLHLPSTALTRGSDPNAPYDIVIILGADYAGVPEQ